MALDLLNPFGFLHRPAYVNGQTEVASTSNVKPTAPSGSTFTFSQSMTMMLGGDVVEFLPVDCHVVLPENFAAVQSAASAAGVVMTAV